MNASRKQRQQPKPKPQRPVSHPGYSKLWYEKLGTQVAPEWMGHSVVKHPLDLWLYQEIIFRTKPELILETGTFAGGSALYLANLCDIVTRGEVVSIDLVDRSDILPSHPRIDFIWGTSSTEKTLVAELAERAQGKSTMVILDSAHNAEHVFSELLAYAPMVSKGNFLIVEDTNPDGYHLAIGDINNGQGPAEAVKRWQPLNRGFETVHAIEQWGFTQNSGGYLRRVR